MSIFRPALQIFHKICQIQQLSPISTTSQLLSAHKPKRPKGKPKCNTIKPVGCAPRARPHCRPVPRERIVCHRLDVPEPSYAECLKDPKPKHRKSECFIKKLPPKDCIKPNRGISIDGCQPPVAPRQGTCKPRNTKAKSKERKCDPSDPCDPDLKPFKSAGPSTSPAMSCPSASTGSGMSCPSMPMTSRMCEPEPSSSPFSTPFRNYSTKCKVLEKSKKPCFETKKVKAESKPTTELPKSPVSCGAKAVTKNKCEQAKCGPSFEPCDKPHPVNQHKCPVRKKKPRMMSSKVVVKKRKINWGYKKCKEPKAAAKFSCKPKKEKKKVAKAPPTPTKCPCFKPEELEVSKGCKKIPGATEPDCNRKGEKRKPICAPKCENKNSD